MEGGRVGVMAAAARKREQTDRDGALQCDAGR